MWDLVGIIAAVVVIVLLLQLLDITDTVSDRIRGKMSKKDLQTKIADLEKRVNSLEKKIH
ncbi:hypothetical protein GF407_01690 [candidate division KSB1 bacterium]|nr:hypothetical protein [candidate division KSB1 bacterium]